MTRGELIDEVERLKAETIRLHESLTTMAAEVGDRIVRIGVLEAENERLRDCLQSIRNHVAQHAGTSALATAVVATCDSGLRAL